MEFKKLFLVGLAIVNLAQLQAADIALTACDTSGAEQIRLDQPCPFHKGKIVSSCTNTDGKLSHTHYNDSNIYYQDKENYKIAYAALRGSY